MDKSIVREATCLTAWRYSNHFVDTFVGDLMVVTEHGWADFMSGWGGREPRLQLPEERPSAAERRA